MQKQNVLYMTVCNNSSHTLVSAFDAFQDKKNMCIKVKYYAWY